MRIVVKVGTHTLAAGSQRLSRPRMIDLVRQISMLHAEDHDLILVSSGAIFAGREVLDRLPNRKDIPFKQTLAAVGQPRLMGVYGQLFGLYDVVIAQALLTRADLADRERYLNARNTLLTLLRERVIPVINENDVVGVEEIRIGDNDNLSALVANLVDAELLIILTDQEGLFTADPRLDSSAELIPEVAVIDDHIRRLAGGSWTAVGTGGMVTKIEAAEMATRSGAQVVIASGDEPDVLPRVVGGERIGTRFLPSITHIEGRKRWILADPVSGEITIDAGATEAVVNQCGSLLAVGITGVQGDFERGRTVRLVGPDGQEVARGIPNYTSSEIGAIRGCHTDEISSVLGYRYSSTVVHRDNMVLI